jgi:hypothetical protein
MWELIASAQDYAPLPMPQGIQKAMDEGTKAEPIILQYLEDNGWVLTDKQKEGHLRVAPNVLIRYHPDALGYQLENKEPSYVVEAKAFGKDLFRRAQLHGVGSTIGEYDWQISIMMHAEQKPGVWVFYNKETGEVDYEYVTTPPIPLSEILTKAAKLVESLDDDLMERPCDDPKHFPCRYIHLRPEPGNGGIDDTLDVESVGLSEEFDQLARDYMMFKNQEDEAKKRKEEIRQQLLSMRGSFKKAKSTRYSITVSKGTTNVIDWKKMEDDGVRDKYVYKNEHDRLTVRGLGE